MSMYVNWETTKTENYFFYRMCVNLAFDGWQWFQILWAKTPVSVSSSHSLMNKKFQHSLDENVLNDS